jgi:hypothetical protein
LQISLGLFLYMLSKFLMMSYICFYRMWEYTRTLSKMAPYSFSSYRPLHTWWACIYIKYRTN